jgi:hypothetical protein
MGTYLGREDSYYAYSSGVPGNLPPDGWIGGIAGEIRTAEPTSLLSYYYDQSEENSFNIPLPKGVTGIDADGNETIKNPSPRKATQSIFNRYSLFYFNSLTLGPDPESYLDKPNRLDGLFTPITVNIPAQAAVKEVKDKKGNITTPGKDAVGATSYKLENKAAATLPDVLSNPTASNIIKWSAFQGTGDPRTGTNAVEYAWEDFLWCKNYGIVPNNYMVTLRRFSQPVNDDIWDCFKIPTPDVSRLICWVDGESNTWESVGMKFTSSMTWKELESEIQTISGGGGGCPDPETPIMINKNRSIKAGNLKVGDIVWTMHQHTMKWGRFPVTRVERIKQRKVSIGFLDGKSITVSTTHQFLDSFGNWKRTYELEVGDSITGLNRNSIIKSMKYIGVGEVMLITVNDAHTYISNGLVSHNKSPGNEGAAIGGPFGNALKAVSWITQKPPNSPPSSFASRGGGGGGGGADPYQNKNVVYGPLDVIKKMFMRDKGLNFEQAFALKFEYELRSIDGINPKVAMIDLLSNVFVMTANRGEFWGGDVRFFGGGGGGGNASKTVGPLGDPKKLLAGDYSGYFKSLTDNIKSRVDTFTGGQGMTLEGLTTAAKGLAGNLMSNIIGGALDNPSGGGGAGAQGINSLLTGEDTGEWHVMVGNPANPIISVGNLILEKSEYYLHGPLGADDFPSKLTVTCNLKPARPRDRSDMMAMFHRGGRTYTTLSPSDTDPKYYGNKANKKLRKSSYSESDAQAKQEVAVAKEDQTEAVNSLAARFPNHNNVGALLQNAAQGIY